VPGKRSKKTKTESQAALSRALAKAVKAKSLSATVVSPATQMVVAVEVDSNHLVPYSVRWDGDRILDQSQSGQATVPLARGNHVLTWSFNHSLETTWRHKLTVQGDGIPAVVLDEKNSTANPNEAVSGGTRIFGA
jgi:hypothetical protein